MKSLNTNTLKKINFNKVYNYIYDNKTVNKVMICNDLDMCLSTVNSNLKELEENNYISKDGYFESTGGRKSDQLIINKNYKFSVGVAILLNKIHIVITDLYCNVINKSSIEIIYNNTEEYYKSLSNKINLFIKNNNIKESDIIGISFAIQGIVVDNKVAYGTILNNETFSIQQLQQYIKYDINLDHDSKCAGNLSLYKHKIENGFTFLLNSNLGSSVIVNSTIIPGYSGTIEHYHLNNENECYCGKKGCLETVCSVNSLESKSGLTIGNFMNNVRNGVSKYCIIWDEFLSSLSLVINNLSLIINGDFILSGELSTYLNESDIKSIREKINSLYPFEFNNKIIISDSGEYTQAIGASLFFINKFIKSI